MLSKVQNTQDGVATKVVDALSAAKELSESAKTTSVTGAVMARRVGRSIGTPPRVVWPRCGPRCVPTIAPPPLAVQGVRELQRVGRGGSLWRRATGRRRA